MQRTILNIAIAAAFTAVAGSAFASAPIVGTLAFGNAAGQYNSGNTAVVKISGSSATNGQTIAWATHILCNTAPAKQRTWTKSSNEFAVVCELPLGHPYDKPYIAVIKNSTGGSGNGVTQLYPASDTLSYLNVFQANPATGANGPVEPSNIGVSDEEPPILKKANAITIDWPETGPTALDYKPLNVVTFGTPVTLNLRNALQTSQIASGKLPNTCAAGNESEACMPSLSQSQIASIFSGNLVNWNEVGLASNPVYIARRVLTSGTQTAARLFFLNDPCADGMALFADGNSGESSTKPDACNAAAPAGAVFEGSGGGNVATCLTNHQRNNRWAIGINSLELPTTVDTSAAYTPGGGAAIPAPNDKVLNSTTQRHIKIDGFAPTTFNVATGRYRFWYEATVNTAGEPTPGSNVADLRDALLTTFNNAAVLEPLNDTFNTTVLLKLNGEKKSAGILATAGFSAPPSPATESNTVDFPESYYTRSISGTPTSCQPAMSLHATGINP